MMLFTLSLFSLMMPEVAAEPLWPVSEARRSPRVSRSRKTGRIGISTGERASIYRSCAEARAAGAAPLRSGQPGYSIKLDRDRDGVACE